MISCAASSMHAARCSRTAGGRPAGVNDTSASCRPSPATTTVPGLPGLRAATPRADLTARRSGPSWTVTGRSSHGQPGLGRTRRGPLLLQAHIAAGLDTHREGLRAQITQRGGSLLGLLPGLPFLGGRGLIGGEPVL